MAYDPVNERVLLYGGAVWTGSYTFFDDLWSYDYTTNTWIEIECDTKPSGRFNHMMVYDPDNHQLVLFGGFSARDRISDTWIYDIDGNAWTQMHPPESPSSRSDGAIVYDSVNKVVILYDGYCLDNSHPQDTWVYDIGENNWRLMDPEETSLPQYGHHMIYDSLNQKVVMYGGHWSIKENGQLVSHGYSDGVWTYDYASDTWSKIDTADSLPGRYWHSLAYDDDTGKMIVYGGSAGGDLGRDDTWLYDLSTNTWERLVTDDKPPGRECSALVYDQTHKIVILFGGLEKVGEPPLNDLWVLDTVEGTWQELSSEPIITEDQEEEPDQTGIPGFPLPSLVLGLVLVTLLLVSMWNVEGDSYTTCAGARANSIIMCF